MPNQIDSLLANASAAHAAGRLKEAEGLAQKALAVDSKNSQANLLLGVIAGKTGRDQEAFHYFDEVIRSVPESFEANFWLSILHRRTGKLHEAIRYAESAVKIRPTDAHSLNNLGLCLLDRSRLEEAADLFRKAGAIRQDLAPIFHNLGTALYLLGNDQAAVKAFERAIALSPRSIDSMLSLGQSLISQNKPVEAVKTARQALTLAPNSARAHLLMASALVEDGKSEEAEPHLKRATELDPADAQAQALLGLRLQTLGRFKEANERLERSVELEPKQGFAYFSLVHNNKIGELSQSLISRMSDLAETDDLPPRERAFLEYGLGKALEGVGNYERAIQHFDSANALSMKLKFADQKFNAGEYIKTFDQIIETFSETFIRNEGATENTSDLPIVIVGMMRSGTTLAEQILSSHPQIGAVGEHPFWPLNRDRALKAGRMISYLELGRQYVASLRQAASGNERVTDKLPANYELAGAIHMALPNAKIIHMRRHPVDTCISIYTTPNRARIPYAYDRENIVLAYKQYLRLMEHWRRVLPPNQMLEVDYEELVRDREAQVRKMIDFLALEWSESLLHHESNERSVLTPSLWQVRQPIYTSSVERWKGYEPWLGAFSELLDAH